MRHWQFAAGVGHPTVLHGGHPASSFEAFHWSFLVVSILLVGGIGGLLYWYYGSTRSRPG